MKITWHSSQNCWTVCLTRSALGGGAAGDQSCVTRRNHGKKPIGCEGWTFISYYIYKLSIYMTYYIILYIQYILYLFIYYTCIYIHQNLRKIFIVGKWRSRVKHGGLPFWPPTSEDFCLSGKYSKASDGVCVFGNVDNVVCTRPGNDSQFATLKMAIYRNSGFTQL